MRVKVKVVFQRLTLSVFIRRLFPADVSIGTREAYCSRNDGQNEHFLSHLLSLHPA